MKQKYNNVVAIILAAGEGTRMKSSLPKVLHPLCARPMLCYVLDLPKHLKIKNVITVLGHQYKEVKKLLEPGMKAVVQRKRLGTADAVKQALQLLKKFRGTVLILYADIPLLKPKTLEQLLKHHIERNLDATILTAKVDNPSGYGRIIRDKYASISGIIEDKDADSFQKDIKEVNTGIICFNAEKLSRCIREIRPNNRKREYYLTDVIGILYRRGFLVESVTLGDITEMLGINSRVDLAKANSIMRRRINERFMDSGVSIVDSDSTFIGYGARIGTDTTIYPFTVIERNVTIGKRCSIGPFAHLKEGTSLEDDVSVGNFIEIVRSHISSKTFVKHFGYLGDSYLGKNVNIGAGCVTANFDGVNKHKTIIADGAFIGSDTVLVAPVKVGKAAKTGAGAVVLKNHNVPAGKVVAGIPAKPLK